MALFRSEINGLRAIAVLAVLLFHAGVPLFHGGFAGVDVFFVISGFLMTRIVLSGLDRGDFSLVAFWIARARRIVPALLGLCVALAILGWGLIDPITYLDIGGQVAASLTFVSNIVFWRESGYFDQAAETKWLLHTWSLSVEWQFYVLYPLVLLAARRFLGKRGTVAMLWLGFLLSLALSVVVTAWRPSIAFYLLPTRAWEMIAGGLVLVHGVAAERLSVSGRRNLEFAGLALVVLSLATIRSATPWPSFWALLPVAGTAAVIFSDRRSASLLNLRPVQALGSCSYSVYLWHWPVIVAFRYYEGSGSSWAKLAEVALGLTLGALSYQIVERPAQGWLSRAPVRRVVGVAVPALGAILVWAAANAHHQGFIDRSPQPALIADYLAARSDWEFPEQGCARAGRDRSVHVCVLGTGQDTLVIGDSHANQWFARAADRNLDTTFVTRDGCPPLPDMKIGPGVDCQDFYRVALKAAGEGPYRRIVVAAFWQSYFGRAASEAGLCVEVGGRCVPPDERPDIMETVFRDFARDLKEVAPGKQIVLVLPDLEPPGDLPMLLAKRVFFGRDTADLIAEPSGRVRARTEQVRMALLKVAAEVGATTVDPLEAECGPVACRYVDQENRPFFRDSNHLRSSVVRTRLDFLDPYLGRADKPVMRDARATDATGGSSTLGLRPAVAP